MKMIKPIKTLVHRGTAIFTCLYLSIGSSKECPICGWTGNSFMKKRNRNKPAPTYVCPRCGSYPRHRFAYCALDNELIGKSENVLHIAPERCIEPWLRKISKQYLSIDLCSPNAMQHMNITNLKLEDNAFSLVWCSHVLEHIENDIKAMQELYRVLRPSSIAVVMVPIYGASTYENPDVMTPEGRLKHFRQEDHVRLYGLDIRHRLEVAGFRVEIISTSAFSKNEKTRSMLDYPSTKEIFLCTKA